VCVCVCVCVVTHDFWDLAQTCGQSRN